MPSLLEVQTLIEKRQLRWTAGENEIGQLIAHRSFTGLGLAPSPRPRAKVAPTAIAQAAGSAIQLPKKHDWRTTSFGSFVTPVRHQLHCGSCVAFAVVAAMESALLIKESAIGDASLDLSEAHLFYCGTGSSCDKGWTYPKAFKRARKPGVGLESGFPYNPDSPACIEIPAVARVSASDNLVTDFERKFALVNVGPVLAGMTVYEDFGWYTGGLYTPSTSTSLGGHAVCVVGYDDDEGAWIVKNSWGTSWGEAGYARIAYGTSGIDIREWHSIRVSEV